MVAPRRRDHSRTGDCADRRRGGRESPPRLACRHKQSPLFGQTTLEGDRGPFVQAQAGFAEEGDEIGQAPPQAAVRQTGALSPRLGSRPEQAGRRPRRVGVSTCGRSRNSRGLWGPRPRNGAVRWSWWTHGIPRRCVAAVGIRTATTAVRVGALCVATAATSCMLTSMPPITSRPSTVPVAACLPPVGCRQSAYRIPLSHRNEVQTAAVRHAVIDKQIAALGNNKDVFSWAAPTDGPAPGRTGLGMLRLTPLVAIAILTSAA